MSDQLQSKATERPVIIALFDKHAAFNKEMHDNLKDTAQTIHSLLELFSKFSRGAAESPPEPSPSMPLYTDNRVIDDSAIGNQIKVMNGAHADIASEFRDMNINLTHLSKTIHEIIG